MKVQGTDIVLGKKYLDPITGITGVATGATVWLYGCARVCLEYGFTNKEGAIESKDHWIDTDRAELVEPAPVVKSVATKSKPITGGPVARETG
jgi:hypothetical protein